MAGYRAAVDEVLWLAAADAVLDELEIGGFVMRSRAIPSSVALLTVVVMSCGGTGDPEPSPDADSIGTVAPAPAAATTVPVADDTTPSGTDPPSADDAVPSTDAPATTDLIAAESSVPSTEDPASRTTEPASGLLVLAPEQLAELSLPGELVGEVMGAELVEVDDSSFFVILVGTVPPGSEIDAHDYWSLDRGERSMGVEPVDYASVIIVLLPSEDDVGPVFEQITNAEPEYTRWEPIDVRGATVAERSVGIPYEGEPEDEPEFDAVLARRDTLLVAATVSGSDGDARVETAIELVELVLTRATELSG